MKINISRQSIYLLASSLFLLVFVLVFSFMVLIPEGNHLQDRWNSLSADSMSDFLDQASHAAYTITKRIGDGSFELTDDKAACRYCKYGTICRIKDYKPNLQSSEVSEEE